MIAAMLTACGGGGGSGGGAPPTAQPTVVPTQTPAPVITAIRISADPFSDPFGQHATEVEPSAATHGQTIVAGFQVARQFQSGGSAIGVATSLDGGRTWTAQTLRATRLTGGTADSASDAAVAYDAAHGVWLIAVLPIVNGSVPYPEVVASIDGLRWGTPVRVGSGDVNDDKEWIACDNSAASPHYGSCYVTWDDAGRNGVDEVSTSSDGGLTWNAPRTSADAATGIGAIAVSQPNGNVTVISDDQNEVNLFAFTSRDGGATWGPSHPIAQIIDHFQAGNLRSGALVSPAVDGAGRIYAVWQDCRFENQCAADDLVLSSSQDGATWSSPQRIPLDTIGSGVDHFIPGLGVDPATNGAGAHLGLTYYIYANAACANACALSPAYSSSMDGATSWSAPLSLDTSMHPVWLARTTEGVMVADYVATVFSTGNPVAIFANANAPAAGLFQEAMYAANPRTGSTMLTRRINRNERPVLNAHSDHPPRHFKP